MGVKYIHVVLIVASIIMAIIFGAWTFKRHDAIVAYASFMIAAGLTVYCIQFIKKLKAL